MKVKLGELQRALVPVLEELKASDLARRPFVVVESTLGPKRFVQFARVVKGDPGDAARGIPPVGEMAFDVPALGIYLNGFGNDPEVGARLAVDTLRSWLPEEAELAVSLDGDEAN